jgi:hypothetical protein
VFFSGDWANHPLVLKVEDHIQRLINDPRLICGRKRLENTEALQVVSYKKGEFYAEHYDNKSGGQVKRAVTIIIYLCDTPKGGATYFPKATGLFVDRENTLTSPESMNHHTARLHRMGDATYRPGLRVFPAAGRAAVFWSRLEDGTEDSASLHAAEPVGEGEKWIATRWFREVEC